MASEISGAALAKMDFATLKNLRDAAERGGDHQLMHKIEAISRDVRTTQRPGMENCGRLFEHVEGNPRLGRAITHYTGDIAAYFGALMEKPLRGKLNRPSHIGTEIVSLRIKRGQKIRVED